LSTRISRASSEGLMVSLSGSTGAERGPISSGPPMVGLSDDNTSARTIAAEIRAAFTYTTIAHLAYDFGQVERGDEAFARAQEACTSARHAGQFLTPAGRELVWARLAALGPALEACSNQRSDFHPTLRQPSLS
jgi:hypothetical protein